MSKRLNPAISACHVCGVAQDEQCVSLRNGRPLKRDHQGGRSLTVAVSTATQLAAFLKSSNQGSTPYSRPVYGI